MRKIILLSFAICLTTICGMVNELHAQPEFATVRIVTAWGSGSLLFITRGEGDIETIELNQKYADRKQEKQIDNDNRIINSVFSTLYSDGYNLVSTASSEQPGGGFVSAGREVIYLLVKE